MTRWPVARHNNFTPKASHLHSLNASNNPSNRDRNSRRGKKPCNHISAMQNQENGAGRHLHNINIQQAKRRNFHGRRRLVHFCEMQRLEKGVVHPYPPPPLLPPKTDHHGNPPFVPISATPNPENGAVHPPAPPPSAVTRIIRAMSTYQANRTRRRKRD